MYHIKQHSNLNPLPIYKRRFSPVPILLSNPVSLPVFWSVSFRFICRGHPVVFIELKVNSKVIYRKTAVAMCTITSSFFSEIYLQYLDNTKIFDILLKHSIIGYFRGVDEILIAYQHNATIIIRVLLNIFNNMTRTMYFTMEKESEKKNYQFSKHYHF
jgi:hypothetical protein